MTRYDLIALCWLMLALAIVAGAAGWRLSRPHTGIHVAGQPLPLPIADTGFYGSMSLAEEASWYHGHESWREAMERELAPEALADQDVLELGEHTRSSRDTPMAPELEHPESPGPAVTEVARKAPDLATMPGAEAGPGDFLSSLSDDDFWNMARFELRRLVFESYEPFKLSAWTGVAA